ncbi:hypothetical protein V5799_008534, partial [Amblyomma americanum]
MQHFTQFNGYYGCSWCLHPGKTIDGTVKYPVNCVVRDRSMEGTKKNMHRAVATGEVIKGLKGVTPLINLAYFDVIWSFSPDYMHCVLLGVSRQLTECWLSNLVLQNRLDKVHQMRIVAFVGSPVTSDKKELLSLAIKLKRENVKVDIVSFGENDLNIPTLTPFLSILNGGGYAGSHMVSVEAGNVLWRVLMNSPIVRAQDDTPFTYRINSLDFDLEDDDPELAL